MILLFACKVLVWSEAWKAEGEVGNTDFFYQHTPVQVRAPALPKRPARSNSAKQHQNKDNNQ